MFACVEGSASKVGKGEARREEWETGRKSKGREAGKEEERGEEGTKQGKVEGHIKKR